MSGDPVDLAEVQITATRMTMTVGGVSFDLEWRGQWNTAAKLHYNSWRITAGTDVEAYRPDTGSAKHLVMAAAPVLAELHRTRDRAAELGVTLKELAREEVDDEPPF